MENVMVGTTKAHRLKQISNQIGTRHQRKLRKFSDGFNENFSFFLCSYRSGLLTFCGENVQVQYEHDAVDCKEGFRLYDDGQFKHSDVITSKHPNILRAVIVGKKSWGLFLDQWTDGIADWCFTRDEILDEFKNRNITIPECFLKDFDNRLEKKKRKRYDIN